MHIPDGYLSPQTCAVMYAAAAPFWYVAGRRVKGVLTARAVPVLSTLAAFTFTIMMFNIPLPGGTTAAALSVLMGAPGLRELMIKAIAAATKRSKELAK